VKSDERQEGNKDFSSDSAGYHCLDREMDDATTRMTDLISSALEITWFGCNGE
jgi:hypothetical protein